MKEIPSGLPSPYGAQRIKNALHEVTASRVEIAKAQNLSLPSQSTGQRQKT